MNSYRAAGQGHWVADVLPDLRQRADWFGVQTLFRQQIQQIESSDKGVPDAVAGAFSDALDKITASYPADEDVMCLHALIALAAAEHEEYLGIELSRKYYELDILSAPPGSTSVSRWRPGTGEAIVETGRRLRDARWVRATLRHKGSSGLRIGSMNYGRFYNIRGNRYGEPASDLDFIFVVERATDLIRIADALSGLACVRNSDVDEFQQRAEVFIEELDDGKTVFSHKVQLWPDGMPDPMLPRDIAPADYLLSMHIMTPPVLKYVLVDSTPQLLLENAGTRWLRDYRESPTGRWDDVLDFAGRRDRTVLGEVQVRKGMLRSPRCYYIDAHDCYFPGFYQSMLMLEPDMLWDDLDIRSAISEFRHKLDQRIRYETRHRGSTMLRPSFAHVRGAEFAPSVIKALDGPYSGS